MPVNGLMQITFVLSRLAAFLLNSLTEVAHVPVSTLGKMFSTILLPLNELNFLSLRLDLIAHLLKLPGK